MRGSRLRPIAIAVLVAVALVAVRAAATAASPRIQTLETPSGIPVWFVHEPSIPIVSVEISFHGGTITDPDGKEGRAGFAAGLLDEGAGDLDSAAFHRRLQELAIGFSASAEKDNFRVGLRTLSANRDEAFRLLGLALTQPRLDREPVDRVRGQIKSMLVRDREDPDTIASQTWFARAFPDHAYGRPNQGTVESIDRITVDDLRDFVLERFARNNMVIGAVGDISPDELVVLVDRALGGLPKAAAPFDVAKLAPFVAGGTTVIRKPLPQSVVTFGVPGISRSDPDYYAAYVMNYVLGGGGFTSRLYQEVRERRGLAYSVYTYLFPYDYSAVFLGGVATANARIAESLRVIETEVRRIADEGITEQELVDAQTYLNGSFPLQLDTNAEIAWVLVQVQLDDLGLDYLERRADYINSVTLDDVKRVAHRLLGQGRMSFVVVGDPEGVDGGG
jgi:zinc protease